MRSKVKRESAAVAKAFFHKVECGRDDRSWFDKEKALAKSKWRAREERAGVWFNCHMVGERSVGR